MFDTASRIEATTPGRFVTTAEPSWYQGRGVYGGLQAAWLVRAMEAVVGSPSRRLRTLTVHCCAPVVAGPVEIEAAVDRTGAAVAHVSARLLVGGKPVATALATFAQARREALVRPGPIPPQLPPPEAVPRAEPSSFFPTFTQHVDYRFALGNPLFSGHSDARLGGWCRFAGPTTPDTAALVALADVWPPAPYVALTTPRPAATVDWTLELLDAAPGGPPGERFWLYECETGAADDGYASTYATLWDDTGRPFARTRQLVALL